MAIEDERGHALASAESFERVLAERTAAHDRTLQSTIQTHQQNVQALQVRVMLLHTCACVLSCLVRVALPDKPVLWLAPSLCCARCRKATGKTCCPVTRSWNTPLEQPLTAMKR